MTYVRREALVLDGGDPRSIPPCGPLPQQQKQKNKKTKKTQNPNLLGSEARLPKLGGL